MQMKPEHFDRLANLASRPDLPLQIYLIMARRVLRHIIAMDERECSQMRREIRAAKRSLPFTDNTIKCYEVACKAMHERNMDVLVAYGKYLRDHHKAFEHDLGWDVLCDVLGVNPVHRAEAGEHARGLFGITWVGGWFEDSAAHYGDEMTGRGPITRAIGVAMTEWMIENFDKLPDPFAPGGPFEGIPTYTQRPDGTMVRNKPTLTIHSPDGASRVVKGKPEVSRG